ncbi:hypothetical protein Mapa_004230 [Marchantia paleacea]|nr:hypothetical protein Mapa_004230 [Marchantia paleacea]
MADSSSRALPLSSYSYHCLLFKQSATDRASKNSYSLALAFPCPPLLLSSVHCAHQVANFR